LGGEVDKFIISLNRGAEEAAKEAKPIFVNAILSMSFSDVWSFCVEIKTLQLCF